MFFFILKKVKFKSRIIFVDYKDNIFKFGKGKATLRIKLTNKVSGNWSQSSGDRSAFGLSVEQVMDVIKKLKANIKDKIVYRSNDLGYKTAEQIKEKFNEVNTDVFQKTSMKDNLQYSRLAICTYPETAVSEIIFAGIPLIIFIPDNLYEFDDDSNEIVEMLKKSKIYF